jgi:hypothetical protein
MNKKRSIGLIDSKENGELVPHQGSIHIQPIVWMVMDGMHTLIVVPRSSIETHLMIMITLLQLIFHADQVRLSCDSSHASVTNHSIHPPGMHTPKLVL